MYLTKLATLFILFTLNLVSRGAEAQTSNASRIFLKDSSGVKIHDDTTLIACQNQEVWLYYKSCNVGDPVIWTNGLSGDSIKVTSTSNLRAYCNSAPENPSEVLYIYFDAFPENHLFISRISTLFTLVKETQPFLNATCEGYRPDAIWQDNRLGLQYYGNQVGLYSAKCINQCGTSDSSTIFLVENTTPIPIAKVITPTKFFCGDTQIQLTTNFSLIKNDTLKQQVEILWSNGSTDTSTIVSGPGTYFYRLKKPSCDEYFVSDSVTIINGVEPPTISLRAINLNAIRNDSIDLCSMESFNLIAEGCTGGTIAWNNGETSPQILVNQTGTYYATCTLPCGTSQPSKKITVYNSNNCQIQPPIFSSSSNPICNSTDKILLTATCSNSTLKWKNPADSINATISVPIGFYSAVCTVRGIESSSSFMNITPSTNSQTPAISANKTILCRGEDATLLATGCFSTNTIWSNGLTGAVIVVKTAGTYTASCSNACGPNLNSNAIIIRSDEQFPAYISISGLPNCDPDSATLTAVNCSSSSVIWSNGATSQSIKVGPGSYSATCQNICGFTVNLSQVTVSSNQQSLVTPTIFVDKNVICNQERAKLTLSGCLSGYILWSSGQIGKEILVDAGTYSARCSNGCDTSDASNTISILKATTPEAPRIFADTIIVCGTNKAVLTTSGCVNSTIRWSTGAISNTISVGVGSYTALCENLCGRSPNSNVITIQSGPPLLAPIISASKGLVCGMEKSILTATGCTNGTITWSAGLGTGNSKSVGAGAYIATCTNSCGTSNQSNVVIINSGVFPSAPIIAANKNIICDGDSATLTASGCSGIINWSNGMTPFQIKIAVPGTYTARCTNSCGTSTNSSPIIINKFFQPEIPILSVDNNQIAIGDTATLSVANCNGTVRWNNNSLGNSIKVTNPGLYSAVCSNICGTSNSSQTLEIIRESTSYRPMVKSNKLVLLPNEMATLSSDNCISNILWSNGSTSNSIEVGAGTYSVSCETSFGYFSSSPIIIIENCGELCLPIQTRKIR